MTILSSFDTHTAAVIIVILSVLAMLGAVSLAILVSVKRGAVRALFDLAVTAVSFFAAAFAASPIAGMITNNFTAFNESDLPVSEQAAAAAVYLIISTAVFLAIFVILQVMGGIIMAAAAKKGKNKGFFRKKLKGTGIIAAAAGIISGMLIFTVICMPFKGAVSVIAKSGKAFKHLTRDGSVSEKVMESVAMLEKNPAKICSDIFGGRFASYRISKVKVSGKNISLQKETENMLDAAGDTFYAIWDASDLSLESRAQIIRKAKDKLETSELIGIFGDRLIQLMPDASGEETDGDKKSGDILGALKEVYGERGGEEIAGSVGTLWETLAIMTEKGYLDFLNVRKPEIGFFNEEKDTKDEEKDEKTKDFSETAAELADIVSRERGISEIMAILASDEGTRQLMPEIFNLFFGIIGENDSSINPDGNKQDAGSMREITVSEARELGTKTDNYIMALGKLVKAKDEYFKENGLNDDASLTAAQAADILKSADAGELSKAISEMAEDKYLGEASKNITGSLAGKMLGWEIGDVSGEEQYKNVIMTLKFNDAAETYSDRSRTTEEKKEKIEEIVSEVSRNEETDYMSLIDTDMIMSALNITDTACANNVKTMLDTMFTELNKADDHDGREKQAVSSALGVAFAGAGSDEELFAEDGIAGTADSFTESIMSSEVMKNTLDKICCGENGEQYADPVGFAGYVSEDEKEELAGAVLTYGKTHALSQDDADTLENILLLFGIKE